MATVAQVTLVGVLSSFLAFLVGLWSATYLQDRDTRRRHLGVVRALRAELARIRRESAADGPAHIPITAFGMRPTVPQLSPWIQGLLSDIAISSPEVVSGILDLERHLVNLKTFETVSSKAQGDVENRATTVAAAKAASAKASEVEEMLDLMVPEITAEAEAERSQDTLKLARYSLDVNLRNVKSTLDDLDARLASLESVLAAGLLTHLPWRNLAR